MTALKLQQAEFARKSRKGANLLSFAQAQQDSLTGKA
jgi:hypothetical protein